MDHVFFHVVRRGADYAQQNIKYTAVPSGNDVTITNPSDSYKSGEDVGEILKRMNIPTAYAVYMVVTILFLCVAASAINYALMHVVATLTMVESAQEDYKPLHYHDGDKVADVDMDPELTLVKQPMITSKIRSSIRHLRSIGGRWAPIRGAGLALFTSFVTRHLAEALNWVVGGGFIGLAIASIASSVILARLSMAWTHIVISAPSEKRWFQRLGSCRDGKWKKVAGPTALLAIARHAAIGLPLFFASKSGLEKYTDPENMKNMTQAEATSAIVSVLGIFFLGLALHVLVVIPAKVTLIRVQASLLSDDEETIVPFDRSFGGKVVPSIVGGSGVIGTLDAWKSFDWASRIRLMKLYFKAFCITSFLYTFVTIGLVIPMMFF